MSRNSFVSVVKAETGEILVERARWCQGWFWRWRGLQFKRDLAPGEALILVYPIESIAATTIHMLFVFFPMAAIWINGQQRVTWTQLARPWRLYYASPSPARYVLEAAPEVLVRIAIGDRLEFVPCLDPSLSRQVDNC